ncbi:ABC transporter permease [Pseudophaeobacter flagellatus]|uniref:ABC transporter permease n=1 Tax=Pseudophaeobacter flagellatus TaxID=2899119 RepID=UPI001E5957E8|nr:ABC transporter permease [Pseudophaeobacter flagellatus]MCD9146968.1 ABC transporter permease [Pseudophaeobacter flagellatus]
MADVSLQTTPRARSGRRNLRLWLPLAWISTLVLAAVLAPLIAPHDPLYQDLFLERLPPFFMAGTEPGYWLGTDSLGRDVLSRVIYGTRIALCVSLIAATATCLVGSTLGLLAGFFGGWWDRVISRLIEIWMAFPPVLFAVLLVAVMGTGLTSVIVAIALIDWTRFARVIRAETMVQAQMDYVDSAQIGGARRLTTLVSEILPNVLPSIVALLMLEMGIAVIVEAILSFVNLSLSSDVATWGSMIAEGRNAIHFAWWVLLFPLIALFLTVLSFSQLGEGLKQRFDPVLQ